MPGWAERTGQIITCYSSMSVCLMEADTFFFLHVVSGHCVTVKLDYKYSVSLHRMACVSWHIVHTMRTKSLDNVLKIHQSEYCEYCLDALYCGTVAQECLKSQHLKTATDDLKRCVWPVQAYPPNDDRRHVEGLHGGNHWHRSHWGQEQDQQAKVYNHE